MTSIHKRGESIKGVTLACDCVNCNCVVDDNLDTNGLMELMKIIRHFTEEVMMVTIVMMMMR